MKRGCLWQVLLLIILAILFVLTEIKTAMNYEHEDDPVQEAIEAAGLQRSCLTCKFASKGECHRFPPQYIGQDWLLNSVNSWSFPLIQGVDWCGEWKPND